MVSRRNENDSGVTGAVGPICQPAIIRSRRLSAPHTFVEAISTQRLACRSIYSHRRAPRSCREVEGAADHQRGGLPVEIGPLSEIFGLPTPNDLQLFHVRRVDLVKGRILRTAGIAA